jgi:hypothetical protein
MRKQLLSIFLMWTILVVGMPFAGVNAQTISKDTIREVNSPNAVNDEAKFDFGKTLSLSRSNVLESPIDFEKIKKETGKNLPRRKMSAKRKAMWIAIWVGIAVGMFFIIKYAKECEIYEENCSFDEVCPCLKYKEKDDK